MALPNDRQLIFQTTSSTHIDLGRLDYTTDTHCYLEVAMYLFKGSLTQTGGYYNIITLMQATFNSDKWDTLTNKTIGGIMLYNSAIEFKNTTTGNIVKWSTSYGSQIAGVENRWVTDDPGGGAYTVPSFTGALLYVPLVKTKTSPIDTSTVSGWSGDWVAFPTIDTDSTSVFLPTSSTATERNYSINSFLLEGNWARQLSYLDSLQNFEFKITNPSVSTLTVFPPAPNIQNPQNVFPYNNIIDATKSTNFSFNFSGSTLGQYVVKIRSMDTGEVIYTSNAKQPFSSSNLPAYNGDFIEVELGALSSLSGAGIINNKQLSWEMDLYEYNTSGNYADVVPFTTIQYYFETLDDPSVALTFTPSFTGTDALVLSNRELEVGGIYSQAQNVPLKHYRVKLYVLNDITKEGTLIKDTGKVFSENIVFDYSSFLDGKNYKLEVSIETQKNQTWEKAYNFEVSYEEGKNLNRNGYAEVDFNKQVVALSWQLDKTASPDLFFEPEYISTPSPYNTTGNKSAVISSGSALSYNNLNGHPYIINGTDFGVYLRVKIDNDFGNPQTSSSSSAIGSFPIFLISTSKGWMGFRVDYPQKKLYFATEKNQYSILNLYSQELFGVQNTSSEDTEAKYMWYVDTSHNWEVSTTKSLFVNPDIGSGHTFLEIYIFADRNTDNRIHYGARLAKDPTKSTSWTENTTTLEGETTKNGTIIIDTKLSVDALLYTKGTEFKNNLSILYKPTLSWNDFPNADILCNYTDTVVSSQSGQVQSDVVGYEIFKQRLGVDYEESIGRYSIEDLQNSTALSGANFTIYDYLTRSNSSYKYSIRPYSNTTFEEPYPVYNVNNISSQEIETDWLGYSLIPLIKKGKKKYGVPSTVGEEYSIWHFMTDRQEDIITQNQDKTLFTSFSSTPKVSVGMLNYDTGSIRCKLGNVSCSSGNGCGEYVEPYLLVEKWVSFVAQNNICLLKNPKGDLKIVSIDSNTTRQYNNEYSNYYKDSDGYVSAYPTNISFSYTEVEKLDEVEIDITLLPKVVY